MLTLKFMSPKQKLEIVSSIYRLKRKIAEASLDSEGCHMYPIRKMDIIDRNLTSIEKQIKRL